MADLQEFSRRIVLRGQHVVEATDALVRKVGLAADQAVVMSTPVDTGRARSNWIAQLGVASNDVIDAYVEGKDRSTEAQNTQQALDHAEGVIKGYTGGQEIHITNNLPYIERLNDGHSAQAPANFVEEALIEAVTVLKAGRVASGRRE